jgi:deoxyribonuclease V
MKPDGDKIDRMGNQEGEVRMEKRSLHVWTLDPHEAAQVQRELRERLRLEWDGRPIRTVGGVDVALKGDQARAALVVLSFPELEHLAAATAEAPLVFPYIPGLLAFREGPAVLAAWDKVGIQPDLLLFDGQGIAHPRGVGIAAQMGLWLERPTIGVAKSRLYGVHEEVGPNAGDWSPLRDPKEPERVIGAVLRSREKVKPLFVSPGHLMDVVQAVRFVIECLRGYRLPEPTRWAHIIGGSQPG